MTGPSILWGGCVAQDIQPSENHAPTPQWFMCAYAQRERREISLHRTPRRTVSRRRTHPRGGSSISSSSLAAIGASAKCLAEFFASPQYVSCFFFWPLTYFPARQIEEAVSEQRHFIRAAPRKLGPARCEAASRSPFVRARRHHCFAGWLAGWLVGGGWHQTNQVQCRSTLFFPRRQPYFGRDTFNLPRVVPRRIPLGSVINMYI